MNIYSCINVSPVASRLTRFYTNTAHDCRKWIILYKCLECREIITSLSMGHPCLYIFPGWAGTIARGHKIYIFGAAEPLGSGTLCVKCEVNRFGNIKHMNIDNFDRLSLQHCYKLLLNFSKVEFKLKRKADNLQFKI